MINVAHVNTHEKAQHFFSTDGRLTYLANDCCGETYLAKKDDPCPHCDAPNKDTVLVMLGCSSSTYVRTYAKYVNPDRIEEIPDQMLAEIRERTDLEVTAK